MKKILLAAAALLMFGACTKEITDGGMPSGGNNQTATDDGVYPGWIRLKLREDASPLNLGVFTRSNFASGNSQIDEIAAKLGATEIRRVYSDGGEFAERRRKYGLHLWYDLKIDESIPVTRAQGDVEALEGVAVAHPVYKIKLSEATTKAVPADVFYAPYSYEQRPTIPMPYDDPQLNKQWHYYNDASLPDMAEGADINLFKCWKEVTASSPDVTVAIIDMGVDYLHPDLAANMWINKGEIPGNGIDDDNNGYIDDIYGWNYADTKENPNGTGNIIPGDHGTHVGGTIAAVNNNGIGVCGVAGGTGNNDGSKIMTLQMVSGNSDVLPTGDMFSYAADNGAVIISCSWGLNIALPQELLEGMTYFYEMAGCDKEGNQTGLVKGGTMIFAAGNAGKFAADVPGNLDMCISVAAMAGDFSMASYSNYSPEVDIMAPGGEGKDVGVNPDPNSELRGVLSTMPNGKYGYLAGTSMATPHVAGVAALIVAKYGAMGFTNEMLRERLLASCRPAKVDPMYVNYVGAGMLDASLIGLENPNQEPGAITDAKAEGLPDKLKISCTVPADGNDMPVAGYIFEYRKAQGNEEWKTEKLINNREIGEKYEYTIALEQFNTYSLKLTPYDRFGTKGSTVTFEGTVLEHTNRLPVVRAKIANITIEDVSDKYGVRNYSFENYFRDPDAAYGDKLTYTVSITNEHIVKMELDEKDWKMKLTPVCKGETVITIRAVDTKGEYVEQSFKYTVKNGDCGNHNPEDPDPEPEITEIPSGLYLYPNPVVSTMNVRIGGDMKEAVADMRIIDASGRQLIKCNVNLDKYGMGVKDLTTLAPGVYTVKVESGGVSYNKTIVKK